VRRYAPGTMSTPPDASPRPRRSRTPLWVIEGLDIARLRAVPLRVVVGAVCAVGILLAIVLPDLVPPTPLVGAAVGVAALLLGLAAAVAVDAADLTVRGPRHVRTAGGELVAILPSTPDVEEAAPLAAAVLDAREGDDQRLLLGLAAAGRDARRCAGWTDALAVALARTGASVLLVDLASGRSERPGLVEVVREGRKLPSVVAFETGLRLARVGAGRDHAGALEVLPTLPARLPRDLDVLLVALPTAASRQVVAATRSLDHVLVVAERDATSRVDLIAGLDALEAAGIAAQVALLDDRTAARLTSRATTAAVTATAEDDPGGEPDEPAADDLAPSGEPDELAAADLAPSSEAVPDEPAAADLASSGEAVPDESAAADLAPSGEAVSDEPAPAAPAVPATPDDGSTEPTEPLDVRAAGSSSDGSSSDGSSSDGSSSDPSRPEGLAAEPDAPPVDPPTPDDPAPDRSAAAGSIPVEDSGIRLLPGAGALARPPASDLVQPSVARRDAPPSVAPRDVDVMLEAAAARAAARAEAEAAPATEYRPVARRPGGERPVGQPTAPQATAPTEQIPAPTEQTTASAPSPRPTPATSAFAPAEDELPEPLDVTDELPRIEGRRGRAGGAHEPDREDLHTTAQLAILLDDLEARRDRP
jgi:hypothetical protein